ncbi:MAG: hypothetical protein SGJ15_13870 [Bacteroidota bacterium]|nr:hypothetical protein [Bacteroidota bacterium]
MEKKHNSIENLEAFCPLDYYLITPQEVKGNNDFKKDFKYISNYKSISSTRKQPYKPLSKLIDPGAL